MKPIIKVDNLGKQYAIGARAEAYRTFRDAFTAVAKAPLRLFRRNGRAAADKVWALRDVGFDVRPGEAVGIIGHNGAGKSTLFKILSRITEPTTGCVDLFGRVGSLLEVGTGFHGELTGRENVYLSGAILGMRRAEIRRKFDSIVEFAEVGEFLDTPVKRYSSGMYVRLAFAVAAHLEPEVLVVDEVLAVGDVAFQRKCLGRMEESAREGRTVLFVSHNMGAIQGLCQRVILLRKGRVAADGVPGRVVREYLDDLSGGFELAGGAGPLQVQRVVLKDGRGEPCNEVTFGDRLTVEVHYHARDRVEAPYFWVSVASQHGPLFGANMLLDGERPSHLEGDGVLSCTFAGLPLLPQVYTVTLGVRLADGTTPLVRPTEVGFFSIAGTARDLGLRGEAADVLASTATPVVVPYQWRLPDGRVAAVTHGRK